MLWKRSEQVEYSNEDYTIRHAGPSDARDIINCMQGVMDEKVYLVSEYYLLTEKGEADRIRNPDDLTLICDFRGKVVGVLTMQRGMHKKSRHTATLGIAISKGYRHKGIGTNMMVAALKWARESGIRKTNLEVFSSNVNAISAYRKIGFQIEGIKKKQFVIDGEYVDDVLMSFYTDEKP